MTIRAKFASKCPSCARRIAVGSDVVWERGTPARHVDCSTAATAEPTVEAAVPAARPVPTDRTIWTRRPDGSWAIRSPGPLVAGAEVEIAKRDGGTSRATVGALLATEEDGAHVYATAPRPRAASASRRSRRCPTGGNCSSFGSGASCGARECDGY